MWGCPAATHLLSLGASQKGPAESTEGQKASPDPLGWSRHKCRHCDGCYLGTSSSSKTMSCGPWLVTTRHQTQWPNSLAFYGGKNLKFFETDEGTSKPQIISRNWRESLGEWEEGRLAHGWRKEKNPLRWSHCCRRHTAYQNCLDPDLHTASYGLVTRNAHVPHVWAEEAKPSEGRSWSDQYNSSCVCLSFMKACGLCLIARLKKEPFSQKWESNHCFYQVCRSLNFA